MMIQGPGAYPDELGEGVVDEGPARQEETAPWTQVMEEEQLLVLRGGEGKKERKKDRARETERAKKSQPTPTYFTGSW